MSEVDELKGKRGVLTREEYTHFLLGKDSENVKCIEFVSLQDMKGSIYFGGQYDKLGEVANMEWDILVVDEAHEGVDTYKTDVAFDRIKRKFTLHLSGTPFKALANNKFADDAIYNWTYADEQKKNVTGMFQQRKKIRIQHCHSLISILIRCQKLSRMSFSRA